MLALIVLAGVEDLYLGYTLVFECIEILVNLI